MNARCIEVIAQDNEDWALAGDQLYVDFNLSKENIPPGTIISIGDAELEITSIPHTGCKKFSERFGIDALKFISSAEGKQLQLRGVNARVIKSGTVRAGDRVIKLKSGKLN